MAVYLCIKVLVDALGIYNREQVLINECVYFRSGWQQVINSFNCTESIFFMCAMHFLCVLGEGHSAL